MGESNPIVDHGTYVPISQDLLTGEASARKKEKLSSVQNPLSLYSTGLFY